ncbi:methionine ABC transporter permease [Atopobacter phocae]|uniref:methionine ABC transporter permease n=1 Tax=Atopobacter phocae TaxID=136492 RepID=UPI000685F70F|nr:methionine ABC transporter permease [Atopobacter phocae]
MQALWETIYMSIWTCIIAGVLGTVIGVCMLVTRPGGLLERPMLYRVLDQFVNMTRAIPFIILLALLVTITRLIVGTAIGATAALVPLVAGTTPFFARQIENALLEVDPGVIEAAQSMGLSPAEIVCRVYLREGLPGIIRAFALTIINVIGLTAMAGAVGAGGLGNLAILRGYNRYQTDVTIVTTAMILLIVFVTQEVSNRILKRIEH